MAMSISALGAYDGNAYENLWKRAQEEPLNLSEVPDCYEVGFMCPHSRTTLMLGCVQESIKPMLRRGQRLAGWSKL